jgi:hypothetical protein
MFTMPFLWSREPFHRLALVMFEMTSRLLRNIGALIIAFLAWLKLKIGFVLMLFALYHDFPHVFHGSLLFLGLLLSYWLVRLSQQWQRIPHRFELLSSSPYKHRRTRTPEFPPGMESNLVQERWKKHGVEEPFLERQVSGASGLAGVLRVRRPLFSVPGVTSQLPQSEKTLVNASFGKVGWN